jgi:hypothetical protein
MHFIFQLWSKRASWPAYSLSKKIGWVVVLNLSKYCNLTFKMTHSSLSFMWSVESFFFICMHVSYFSTWNCIICVHYNMNFFLGTIDETFSVCVLESDFGFALNCNFKKAGLFRVRNLGGLKAHFGLGNLL